MPVTAEQLRTRLGWDDIREEPLAEYGMRWFRAMPADPTHSSVDFLFDEAAEDVQQVGNGDWHTHPGSVDAAVEMARKLIYGELCILEEWSSDGHLSGSGPVSPTGLLNTLRANAGHLVRRCFGKPPVREAIPFERYTRGKHLWVENDHRAALEASWRRIGRPPPTF